MSSTEDEEEEEEEEERKVGDHDHEMADCSESSSSIPAASNVPTRYRLRKNLLMKRARSGGSGGGSSGSGSGSSGGGKGGGTGYPGVPRVPLSEVVGVCSGGPSGRREGEVGHDPETYGLFVNLVERMLDQRPETR